MSTTQHIAQAITFTAAIVIIISSITLILADYKDREEIDEILGKKEIEE